MKVVAMLLLRYLPALYFGVPYSRWNGTQLHTAKHGALVYHGELCPETKKNKDVFLKNTAMRYISCGIWSSEKGRRSMLDFRISSHLELLSRTNKETRFVPNLL